MKYLLINDEKYDKVENIKYNSEAYTEVFQYDHKVIMIDHNVCDTSEIYSYEKLTNSQNRYVYNNDSVYRFYFTDDLTDQSIEIYLNSNDEDYDDILKYHLREHILDGSPLESKFEDQYIRLFGYDAIQKLRKEYAINDNKGHTYNFDFYLESPDEKIAIEENGVNYHHPQIVGIDKYKKLLHKQNMCFKNGIKLYRFSTQDLEFEDKFQEDMNRYFYSVVKNGYNFSFQGQRSFELYQHQQDYLDDIDHKRNNGLKACLVVLPTAAGKSLIVEEDLKRLKEKKNKLKVLVLVPSNAIKNDWIGRFHKDIELSQMHYEVMTYNGMGRKYHLYGQDEFDYIVVDEAHHAVAPILKRTIQYFNPQFLIGLTATPKRLDNQKLEEVFGLYETRLTLKEAMERNIISQASVYRIETNINLSKVKFNGKDYINSDLEKNIRVTSRNELIAQVLTDYFSHNEMKEKQGVIFCVNKSHAKEMVKVLKGYQISAEVMISGEKNNDKVMKDFKEHKIRFLCTCNMLSEGWDYPSLEILVMARPTMSKVLYLQQIGRGLRKTKDKDRVYVIDVVDEYGAMLKPWTMHSIFKNTLYVPFGDIIKNYHEGDMITVDGLHETITNIKEIDITTFEDKYGDYINHHQLAIECFVNDKTITNWIKKKEIVPDLVLKLGTKPIYLFSEESKQKIFEIKNISPHNEETIRKDFYDFLEAKDYSCSYKMIFMLSVIKNIDRNGEANIDKVLDDYIRFYEDRIDLGLQVDKKACKYDKEKLHDRKDMKENMLVNPFEKYERKRFMFYSKDLAKIAFSSSLWETFNHQDLIDLQNEYRNHLINYYENMGGLQNIDYLMEEPNEL